MPGGTRKGKRRKGRKRNTPAATEERPEESGLEAPSALAPVWGAINNLQSRMRKQDKPWYLNASTIVALLALLLSTGTAALSEYRVRNQKVHNARSELRDILTRLASIERESVVARNQLRSQHLLDQALAAIRSEMSTLADHADEIVRDIDGHVYSSEFLMVAAAAWQRDVARTKTLFRRAIETATTPVQVAAAQKQYAKFLFARGDVEAARAAFEKAVEQFPLSNSSPEKNDLGLVQQAYIRTEWASEERLYEHTAEADAQQDLVESLLAQVKNKRASRLARHQVAQILANQRLDAYEREQAIKNDTDESPGESRETGSEVFAYSQMRTEADRLYAGGAIEEAVTKYGEIISDLELQLQSSFTAIRGRILLAALNSRAAVYYNQQKYGLCIADYERSKELCFKLTKEFAIVELIPEYAATRAYLGHAYLLHAQPRAALKELTNSIALQSDFAWAYLWRGDVHEALGDGKKAEADWRKAEEHARDANTKLEAARKLKALDMRLSPDADNTAAPAQAAPIEGN